MGAATAGVSRPAGSTVDSAGPGRYAAELCGPACRHHPARAADPPCRLLVRRHVGLRNGRAVAAGGADPDRKLSLGRGHPAGRSACSRPVLSHLPAWGVAAIKPVAPLVLYTFGGLTAEQRRLCAAMFCASGRDWLRWAIGAILHWRPNPIPDLPVFHIHGRRDRMIRASRVAADEVLPDGGHLINMSHAEAVNAFIRAAAAAVGE